MSIIGDSALVVAVSYLLISLVFQIRPLSYNYPTLDRLAILPRWKFFTIDNANYDLVLEIQDRLADNQLSIWTKLSPNCATKWRNALWYPEKFRLMVFMHALFTLEHRIATGKEINRESSRAYATLFAYCAAAAPALDADARRIRIARVRPGVSAAEVLFESAFEPL